MKPVGAIDRLGIERRCLFGGSGPRPTRECKGHERNSRNEIRSRAGHPAPDEDIWFAPWSAEAPSACGPFAGDLTGLGERLTFLFGVLLAMSSLTGWYTGAGNGTTVSVIGWHTGTIGKIVLVVGLVAVLLVVLREVGVTMPAAVPESLVTIAIGSIATMLVLVRLVSIPDTFFFASRGIGIWISLVCAIGIIVAGLLEASEEL